MKTDTSRQKLILCFLTMILILPLTSLLPSNQQANAQVPIDLLQNQEQRQLIQQQLPMQLQTPMQSIQQEQMQALPDVNTHLADLPQSQQILPSPLPTQSSSQFPPGIQSQQLMSAELQQQQVNQQEHPSLKLPPGQLSITQQQQNHMQNQQMPNPNPLLPSQSSNPSPTPYYSSNTISGQSFGDKMELAQNVDNSASSAMASDGNNVYVVLIAPSSSSGNTFYIKKSTDGGNTFEDAIDLLTPIHATNPSLAVVGNAVYLAYETFTTGFQWDIFLRISTDGGLTFGSPINISDSSTNSGRPSVDASGTNIYITWHETVSGDFQVFFKKSNDGGNTFSQPINLSNNPVSADTPRIASDGNNVHVVWIKNVDTSYIVTIRNSYDGGNTFGNEITVNPSGDMSNIDASGGNVYVVWRAKSTSDNTEVWLKKSSDGGNTFGDAINVSQTSIDFSILMQPSSISVSGNIVYVVWSEGMFIQTPNGRTVQYDVFFKKSGNGGHTFGPLINLSNSLGSSSAPAVTGYGNNAYVVWREHNNEINRWDLLFTGGSTAKATLFINGIAPKQPSKTLTIQGYLRDSDSSIGISGKSITFAGTNGTTAIPASVITAVDGTFRTTATTGTAEGKYWISAQFAGDSGYPSTTGQRSFIIDTTVPEVTITSPLNNKVFKSSTSIAIKADAKDKLLSTSTTYDGRIGNVELLYKKSTDPNTSYILIKRDTVAPYDASISGLAEGTYNLIARAYDEAGNRKTSGTVNFKIDNTVPEVRITSPANGATFTAPTTITITADAKDKLFSTSTTYDSKVTKVELLYKRSTATDYTLIRTDTVAPYDAKVSNLPAGDYNIIARAYDEAGNRKTSSTVTVSVR